MIRFFMTSIVCIAAYPIFVLAQESPQVEKPRVSSTSRSSFLHGKHRIAVSLGLLVQANSTHVTSVNQAGSDSRVDGAAATLAYTHWFRPDWAINISLGVLGAETRSSVGGSGVSSETGSVIPLLFGMKYQPAGLALNQALRPYVSASVGPYLGFATKSRAGLVTANDTISEATFGMHLSAGLDWFLGRFSIGANAGYHLVADFQERIGSQKNYSGPEFSLVFGILFGKGADK